MGSVVSRQSPVVGLDDVQLPSHYLATVDFAEQARQDSNLQPPVLETGALPLELRT